MARILDRQQAINLRLQGWTYSSIKKELGISKSTLSEWLGNYPLTQDQLALLKRQKVISREIAIEKTRNTKQKKKSDRLKSLYTEAQNYWEKLSKRELILAGLFLYWGEGGKTIWEQVSLNNTDPQVLKFAFVWLTKGLGVPQEKIKVYLHLYNDMDRDKEITFWSKELKLPLKQFSKPYIKKSSRSDLTHKGYGHGTCGLLVSDTRLKEKIMMSIKAIVDDYSRQI